MGVVCVIVVGVGVWCGEDVLYVLWFEVGVVVYVVEY